MNREQLYEATNDPLVEETSDEEEYEFTDIIGVFVSQQKILYHVMWKASEVPEYTHEDNMESDHHKEIFWNAISSKVVREQMNARIRPNGIAAEVFHIFGHYVGINLNDVYYYVNSEDIGPNLSVIEVMKWVKGEDLRKELVKQHHLEVGDNVDRRLLKYAYTLPPSSANIVRPEIEDLFLEHIRSPMSVRRLDEALN